jgi:putative spermidine/putrescine transport system permease protein
MNTHRTFPYLLLVPTLLVIGVLFLGGVGVGIVQSLGYLPVIGLRTWTLDHYVALLTGRDFYISLGVTLYMAVTSTVLATVLALAAAMVLRRSFVGRRWMTAIFQLPLPVPHLVAAAGIVLLLTQSGLIARGLYAVNLLERPGDFPALVFDRGYVGAILVYTWKEVPFIGLVVLAVLRSVGVDYEEAAQTLGANAWQRFRYVLLPLVTPGIVSTSIIVFAFLFGSFEIPLLLGVRYPNTLPVTAYRAYTDPDLTNRPEAMAMGVVITLIVIGLMAIYRRLAGGRESGRLGD